MPDKNLQDNAAWPEFSSHVETLKTLHMRELFQNEPNRFDRYHIKLDGLLFDYSKNIITDQTCQILNSLAQNADIQTRIKAMLNGDTLNWTEERAALHTALRTQNAGDINVEGESVQNFVQQLQQKIRDVSDSIRSNKTIEDVIHIGIGGSDLGPKLVCEALQDYQDGPNIHFVGNLDDSGLVHLFKTLTPSSTAVIIASKTFTTYETMHNARIVKDWLDEHFTNHAYAISSATDTAQQFGIDGNHILPMRDWIGGRFSVWSGIGLPIAIALGFAAFKNLLDGARIIDQHFSKAPLDKNIPVLMAMLGILYRNGFDYRSHALLPYSEKLQHFCGYMQQLDMESNGKAAQTKTGPTVFGGVGTTSQHAFMQSLHQGTDVIPADFILFKDHQADLNANALAQSQALMMGQDNANEPHRYFPGNRPSNILIFDELNPRSLGQLMALYEHKIFVQGVLWGINSFDQWGVELGKQLAKTIQSDLESGSTSSSHDCSTASLIRAMLDS